MINKSLGLKKVVWELIWVFMNALKDKQKIHWVILDRMCLSKEDCGLGFRDIEVFNEALLAKQAWFLLQNPNSLFSQIMTSKYYANDNFLYARLSSRPYFAWRSILYGRDLLTKGLYKMVGNGLSLKFWTDSWIRDGNMRRPFIINKITNSEIDVETGLLISLKISSS
ncbi:hypothetical protein N665_0042s0005 [Sinapis alba]|nr:hypothetical protein N665_0042s0005 [Sinapis alba]